MKYLLLIITILVCLTGCVDYKPIIAEKDNKITELSAKIEEIELTAWRYKTTITDRDNTITALKAELAKEKNKIPTDELKEFSTESDLRLFLFKDNTNKQTYVEGKFDCNDFALMLSENARKQGYRIYMVFDKTHVLNVAFVKGLAYGIEPQTDEIVFVKDLN